MQPSRYTKTLPKDLRKKYEQAAADPELLSLRADIALIQTRINLITQRIETGESGEAWANLQKAFINFDMAMISKDMDGLNAAVETMKGIISEGTSQETAWDEVIDLIQRKKEIAGAEWKRLLSMQQMISSEMAYALVEQIMDVVLRHVTEPGPRKLIAAEIGEIVGSSDKDGES